MSFSRRQFLHTGFQGSLGAILGSFRFPAMPNAVSAGILPFLGEGETPLNTIFGKGLNGRLVLDLSQLQATDLIIPNDDFFIRTRFPAKLYHGENWKVRISGLKEKAIDIPVTELQALAKPKGIESK